MFDVNLLNLKTHQTKITVVRDIAANTLTV